MKNILIATDFSEGSKNAIEHAGKIAKQLKAKLIYLHAHYPVVPTNYLDPNGIYLSTPETDIQGTLKDLKKALSHFQEEDKSAGVSSEIRVELGDLSSCIQTIEEQEKLDLVIISKTSQTNFLDKLIGSTAKGLLHDLHVPLLIIPSNFHADIFEKVLYATQLEFDEIPYIKSALKWSEKGKNKLTIAHLDVLSDKGINWVDVDVLSDRGVNWVDIDVLSDKGINWLDVDVMSDKGVNWVSVSDLSNAGINWMDAGYRDWETDRKSVV